MTTADPDVIVVGAGSAGSVIASRLTEEPGLRVTLVEAGTEAEDPRIACPADWALLQGSALDWAYETVPQASMAGRIHPCPRGRVVGGSSAINAMGHVRGHPQDFDAWEDAGATGWTWDSLAPFFAKSETSCFAGEAGYGTDGPMRLMQPEPPHPLATAHRAAGAEQGLKPIRDHNGLRVSGPTLNTLTIRDGRRQSVADAYLPGNVRARANLRLETGILVDRLTFSEDGRADGIVGRRGNHRVTLSASRAVILAAGTIGTPMILMRSGIGAAADLARHGIAIRHDLPGVGQNLQDHLLSAGNVYSALGPVPQTGTQHSESLTYIHAKDADQTAAPDLVVGICSLPIQSDALSDPAPQDPGSGYTLMFGVTHPRSRGTLSLMSRDPQGRPAIDPRYLSAPRDRRLSLEALHWARRLGHSRAYSGWRKQEIYPRPDDLQTTDAQLDFIERAAITHHHPIGTCRMGYDDWAVVRPDLSVAGVPGLYILDGSILPSLTTGPVNAAIIAVAERGVEIVRQQLSDATW